MTVWFNLFPVQANKKIDLLAIGQKVHCTQKPHFVNYFYGDNLIYYGN